MKTYPWYMEDPSKFERNPLVRSLNTLQFGAFMKIRHAMWLNEQTPGCLPLVPGLLRNIAGMSNEEWLVNEEMILLPFSKDKKSISCQDLLDCYAHAAKTSKERSKAGAKGGRPSNADLIQKDYDQAIIEAVDHYAETIYRELKGATDNSRYRACQALQEILNEGSFTLDEIYTAMDAYLEEIGRDDPPMPFKAAKFFQERIYENYL